jgi:peptidoglycan/xylan/chitin deacetylase (PgdA/CDA1 family)
MLKLFKSILLQIGAILTRSTSSKVVFYHDVHCFAKKYTDMSTSIEMFSAHIDMIHRQKFEIVTTISEKSGQVQICFDDGFMGIYDNRNYFIEQKIYPTVFLAVSLVGTDGYLGRDEIIELHRSGFRFQSHAWSHENLTLFDDKLLAYELEASKEYLEKLLDHPVNEICFPLGYFSDRVCSACLKAGYQLLYSSIPGSYHKRDQEGLIPRHLVQSYTPHEVIAVLHGGLLLFKNRYRKAHYVVHDLSR